MRRFSLAAAWSGIALGLWAGAPASATTVVRMELAEQVDRAQLIFVGTAVSSELVLPEGGSYPSTLTTFRVEQVLKGRTEEPTLALQFLGGDGKNGFAAIHGMPVFAPGETYLLLVSHNGEWISPIVGFWQGKLDFTRHPTSGEPILQAADGRMIQGIAGRDWQRVSLPAEDEAPGFEILATDGVTLEPVAPNPNAPAAPDAAKAVRAEGVIAKLQSFIRERGKSASFQPGMLVRSADPATSPLGRPTRPEAPRGGLR